MQGGSPVQVFLKNYISYSKLQRMKYRRGRSRYLIWNRVMFRKGIGFRAEKKKWKGCRGRYKNCLSGTDSPSWAQQTREACEKRRASALGARNR